MEEPQLLINPPMEIENQQESPQLIPEIQHQAEPEPLQPDNQPNEPNEPDNIVLDTVINQVEPIQEEPKPEVMETEPEPPKESLNLVEDPVSPISVEKENILPDEPYTIEEIDKPEEIVELPQLEPIKSQNATSLDDIPDDLKDQEVKKSLIDEGDDVDYEEAIRELDELFNSGEDTTKDPITPPKEIIEGEQEEKENDIKIKIRPGSKSQTIDFASQPSGSGSKKGKQTPVSVTGEKNSQQQKRGRKKLTKLTESNPFMEEFEEHLDPTERLFKLTNEKKFKIPNKDLDIEELKQRYHNIIYNFRSESEVACLVCLDDESAPEDDIIICDLCSSAFHQSCYGSDLLNIAQDDDSEWHCQRCAFLLKNNLPPEGILCMFCPELKGPIKRVRNSNSHEWAHIVCVNWIPEIYYQEEREKANVYITEYKAKKHCGRKYLDCDFCHIGYGDCIDCDNDKCKRAFHVTCAQKHGLICNWKEMKDMKRDQDTEFYTPIYCKHHMQLYSQAMFDFSNKVEARNEGRGLEVSLLLDPETIAKSQPPKRSHKGKKRLPEIEKSEEKEYDPDVKSYSPDGEPSKRRSRRTRQQIEEEEERREFKTRGRTAKKSVVSQDNETPDKMREPNSDSERKFEVEAHYEEKPRREHPGSKKEMDSSFISTGRVMAYTTMEEEEPESKKSTPVKSKKQSGGTVTEHKAEPKHNVTHKKEKTGKKEKKREKMEHVEKSNKRDRPDKTVKEEQAEKKEHSGLALYKFRPNMAKLLMFNGWGTEKEIKTVISDYIKAKGLYRKDDEEIDVTRDKDLEDIMGLERISRKQIFNEFLHFMLKKTPEEIVRDDNDTPFISLYEEEYKKAKEKENNKMQVEEKQGEQKIKKKPAFSNTIKKGPVKEATRPLAQSQTAAKAKNTLTQNTASKPIERPFQQIFGKESMSIGWQPTTRDNVKPKPQEKESDLDFFEWAPKHNENKPTHQSNIAKPLHSSQPIQKSHVISVEEEKEPPILKRMKINTPPKSNSTVFSSLFANKESKEDRQNTNKEERHNTPAQPAVVVRSKKNDPYEDLGPLINRVDKMPFRRSMNWFVKTDSSLAVSSINSQTARERFWPKEANQLF